VAVGVLTGVPCARKAVVSSASAPNSRYAVSQGLIQSAATSALRSETDRFTMMETGRFLNESKAWSVVTPPSGGPCPNYPSAAVRTKGN
jgi:hypothetical protein